MMESAVGWFNIWVMGKLVPLYPERSPNGVR